LRSAREKRESSIRFHRRIRELNRECGIERDPFHGGIIPPLWRIKKCWPIYRIQFNPRHSDPFSTMFFSVNGKTITVARSDRFAKWLRDTYPRMVNYLLTEREPEGTKEDGPIEDWYSMLELWKSFPDRIPSYRTHKAVRKERKGKKRQIL
jgi:hypothetical protein